MVGPNFKRMDRSPEKSASITVTIQPSRLADGEFFSSLLKVSSSTTPIKVISAAQIIQRIGSTHLPVGVSLS
jgi:hypothetical protein